MFRSSLIALTFSLAALGSAALAEEEKTFTDSVLSYSAYDVDGTEVQSLLLSVTTLYDFGDYAISATYAGQSGTVGDDGFGTLNFTGTFAYDLSPAASVYVSGGIFNTEFVDTFTGELGLTYEAGPLWASAFVGDSSSDDVIADEYAGISLGYALGQGTEAVLSYYAVDSDTFDDITALNLVHHAGRLSASADVLHSGEDLVAFTTAEYALSDRFGVLADYDYFDLASGAGDRIALGGTYDLEGALGAFAKVSRTRRDGASDVDGLTVGLTYATGTPTLRGQSTFDRVVVPLAFSDPLQRF